MTRFLAFGLIFAIGAQALSAPKRARDWGVPFDGQPGPFNAITDVKGVEVGMVTLNSQEAGAGGKKIFVPPGVPAFFPAGKTSDGGVPGGWFSLNGNGELTGTAWIDESGMVEGPIVFTNTHS